MLRLSVDWFVTWLPNIHSSLFYNVYSFLNTRTSSKGIRAIIDAYRLYLENAGVDNAESAEPVLSFPGLDAGAVLRQRHAAAFRLPPVRRAFHRARA